MDINNISINIVDKVDIMNLYKGIFFFVLIWAIISTIIRRFRYEHSNYKKETGATYRQVHSDRGRYGEYLTYKELEYIKGPHKILTNVYIPTRNGNTTEIDLIYIHESGIYVLESKNYGGWIFGNEGDRTWTQVFKNQRKEKFYNPVLQNKGHINNLIRYLNIDESYMKSIIVFSERCTLKKITVYSPDIRIIKRNDLVRTIKRLIKESNIKIEENRINELYNILKNCSNVSEDVKNEHINYINMKKNRY